VLKNIDDNDKILIQELKTSFLRQTALYKELREAVTKTLGKLVLSRGELSALKGDFERNKTLLETIERERAGGAENVERWHKRKTEIPVKETEELNGILDQTQVAIREFLDEEENLKKYLERIVRKGSGTVDERRTG
jgi:hypothetical protein